MILRSLDVRNIRSYASGTVPFESGTTLLTGDVGAGKTSLLYAIEMALFGFAEVDPGYLVRHRAREAEVALTLEEGARRFEFRRRFRRRTLRGRESFEAEESSFSVDGARTRYSATELRQRAIELLGFPDNPNPRAHSDVWRWAVYIPQERMRDVLLQSPTERLETVRKALGLEQYQTAAENAQEVAAELRRIAELHEAEAEQLRHWVEELPRWSAIRLTRGRELEALEAQERLRREERERAEARLKGAEEALARRAEERREHERLGAEASALSREAEAKQARGRLQRAKGEELGRTAADLRERLSSLEPERVELGRRRARLTEVAAQIAKFGAAGEEAARREAALAALERTGSEEQLLSDAIAREHAELEAAIRGAESEGPRKAPPAPTPRDLTAIVAEAAEARAEADRWREEAARRNVLARDLEEILKAGRCPRCHQAVRPEEFREHSAEAEAARKEAENALGSATERCDRLEEERGARQRYELARERFLQVDERRTTLRTQLARLEERARELARVREEHIRERERIASELTQLGPSLEERRALLAEQERLGVELAADERRAAESARIHEQAEGALAQARLLEEEASHLELESAQAEAGARERTGLRARLESGWRGQPDLERAVAETRSASEAARSELERTLSSLAATRAALEEADRRITESDSGVRARSERIAESAHARELAGWIGREFREGLLDLEHRRLSQAQAEFNRAFSRYFQTLIEDPNLAARCDVAFSPNVEIDGEPTPPEALSGGERTALALAFRLAMGRVVRGAGRLRLETLILDEPTDGFSPEQVSRMGELVDELGLSQVLLVSHETQLSGVADRVLRVRKQGGLSRLVEETDGGAEPPKTPPGEADRPAPRPRVRSRRRLTREGAGTPPSPTAGAPRLVDSR